MARTHPLQEFEAQEFCGKMKLEQGLGSCLSTLRVDAHGSFSAYNFDTAAACFVNFYFQRIGGTIIKYDEGTIRRSQQRDYPQLARLDPEQLLYLQLHTITIFCLESLYNK